MAHVGNSRSSGISEHGRVAEAGIEGAFGRPAYWGLDLRAGWADFHDLEEEGAELRGVKLNLGEIELDKIYQGDCIELMRKIPNESVDMVLTDPPFMISKEATITRGRNPLKYKFVGKDISFMFGSWDVFESEEKYWEFTFNWMDEAWRVMRKGAHLLIFFDKFKITPLVKWIKEHDGIARQPLFWIKENPVPMARKVSFMNAISLIFWATKHSTSRRYATFHYELGQHPDYEFAPICGGHERYDYGFHPTQKPEKIISWLLEYLSNENDVILDPFVGSGTTCVVARRLNRHYIGFEIDPKYVAMARQRLATIPGRLDHFINEPL
jgi:DNA modification methylase